MKSLEAPDIDTTMAQRQAASAIQTPASSFVSVRAGQSVVVRRNSSGDVGERPRLNFIEGTNILLTVVDDPISDEVDITVSVSPGLLKNNYTAVVPPAVTDDSGLGYARGSRWIDSAGQQEYVCINPTAAAAVWKQTT